MSTNIPKACREKWTADLAEYRAARSAFLENDSKSEPSLDEVLLERCTVAEAKVLGQRAPDIDAVAEKLLVILEQDIWCDTEEARALQIAIGDLRILARSAK